MSSIPKQLLKISPSILYALKHAQPIVSLQSTIISHGMPYPDNKICALEVEEVVRKHGAVPATVALMHGQIRIGLDEADIQELAKNGSSVTKVSRRDIPFVLAKKSLGSTTVAGTMVCSALAGIEIFATGGLGGVHRDYNETMDVSADLRELGRTPVTVVSAGVKNILDIKRTLQYLQTEGVPIITYRSKYFPAFFSPSSGIQSPLSLDSIEEITDVIALSRRLSLQNGILVGVPAKQSENGQIIQQSITRALKEARERGVSGAATTPFLLKKVHQYSGGASIKANIDLVKNNAQIAAKIAVNYIKKRKADTTGDNYFSFYANPSKSLTHSNGNTFSHEKSRKIIVIGGSAVDFQVKVADGKFELYQSCKGIWRTSYGGVGRNIAEVISKMGVSTAFITALGGDKVSEDLRSHIISTGVQLHEISEAKYNAPTYLGVLDDSNDAIIGISDMEVNNGLTFEKIYQGYFKEEQQKGINASDIVIIDANVDDENGNLVKILQYLNDKGYFVIYECKGKKAIRVVRDGAYKYISLLKMNQKEKELIISTLKQSGIEIDQQHEEQWFSENVGIYTKNKLTEVNAIITNGPQHIKLIYRDGNVSSIQPVRSEKVTKTTGAGDTMTGVISALLLKGYQIENAVRLGTVASKMTVESQGVTPICQELTFDSLNLQFQKCRAKNLV